MKRERLRPGDWALIVLLPLTFVGLAVWGVLSLSGGVPEPSVIQRIRDEAVRPGMTEQQVVDTLGAPDSIIDQPDGSGILRYSQTRWNAEQRTFVVEDADIKVSAEGTVTSISFTATTPPPAGSTDAR